MTTTTTPIATSATAAAATDATSAVETDADDDLDASDVTFSELEVVTCSVTSTVVSREVVVCGGSLVTSLVVLSSTEVVTSVE